LPGASTRRGPRRRAPAPTEKDEYARALRSDAEASEQVGESVGVVSELRVGELASVTLLAHQRIAVVSPPLWATWRSTASYAMFNPAPSGSPSSAASLRARSRRCHWFAFTSEPRLSETPLGRAQGPKMPGTVACQTRATDSEDLRPLSVLTAGMIVELCTTNDRGGYRRVRGAKACAAWACEEARRQPGTRSLRFLVDVLDAADESLDGGL
jgi:hypothetical protein